MMIGSLQGVLTGKTPPQILLDVQGVGYEVDVPMSTFYTLPNVGESVRLYTHLTVREDAHLLFGFATLAERNSFRILIKVSGIGARIALAILSGMSVDELANTLAKEDASRLAQIPGIGKKTAERLIIELRGKLSPSDAGGLFAAAPVEQPSVSHEVQQALLALGYSEKEAIAITKTLPTGLDVNDGIRFALKSLAKG